MFDVITLHVRLNANIKRTSTGEYSGKYYFGGGVILTPKSSNFYTFYPQKVQISAIFTQKTANSVKLEKKFPEKAHIWTLFHS